MSNLFIEYPKCTTCQRAKKWLSDNNIRFEDRHIVEQIPSVEELERWIKLSNKEAKKWFNTSGLKYKELNLKEKLCNMSEKEKVELLASNGMLIKRPLLITKNTVLIGFKQEEWESLLK